VEISKNQEIGKFYDSRGQADQGRSQEELLGHFFFQSPYLWVEKSVAQIPRAENSRYLDLCCGNGRFCQQPADLGYQVFGVDLSEKSIQAARDRFDKLGKTNINLEVGEAMEYLKNQENFDVIHVSGSLYYLPRPQAVEDIAHKLKNQGHFFCVETNGSNPLMNGLRGLRSFLRKDRDRQTLHGLIRLSELQAWKKYFGQAEIQYFDFLTLGTRLLTWSPPVAKMYWNWARRADFYILNKWGLRFLAFKFVFRGRK